MFQAAIIMMCSYTFAQHLQQRQDYTINAGVSQGQLTGEPPRRQAHQRDAMLS
jgi:hypothetical protein